MFSHDGGRSSTCRAHPLRWRAVVLACALGCGLVLLPGCPEPKPEPPKVDPTPRIPSDDQFGEEFSILINTNPAGASAYVARRTGSSLESTTELLGTTPVRWTVKTALVSGVRWFRDRPLNGDGVWGSVVLDKPDIPLQHDFHVYVAQPGYYGLFVTFTASLVSRKDHTVWLSLAPRGTPTPFTSGMSVPLPTINLLQDSGSYLRNWQAKLNQPDGQFDDFGVELQRQERLKLLALPLPEDQSYAGTTREEVQNHIGLLNRLMGLSEKELMSARRQLLARIHAGDWDAAYSSAVVASNTEADLFKPTHESAIAAARLAEVIFNLRINRALREEAALRQELDRVAKSITLYDIVEGKGLINRLNGFLSRR